jgi:hypothetical protein
MRTNLTGSKFVWLALLLIGLFPASPRAELGSHDYSVELTAQVAQDPARIQLNWQADANATSYTVSRKLLSENSFATLANLPAGALTWTDGAVSPGVVYEYQVVKQTSTGQVGYGYICSAIGRPATEDRGRLILLVESGLAAPLAIELLRLQQDLAGDGWTVVRRDVSKTQSVTAVKAVVKAARDVDPANTKALFLFGHIPVPKSGNIRPDGHDDHRGAWAADVYYGEFAGNWTDSTVTTAAGSSLPNAPGDGRFDQDMPPGPVTLQIGRVDLSNLTSFANKATPRSELDLARAYLNKDHLFRHGKLNVPRRGLIYESSSRGLEPEPQGCAAWRSFPGFFGPSQINVIGPNQYLPVLATNAYLFSYVRSAGSYYESVDVANSDQFALTEPKVVFTSFLGSYFGDWDRESAFMRAALGSSGYILTSVYSGQPQWLFHPMSMGETIGHCAMITQNNRPGGTYPPHLNDGAGQVHIALLGDPTLRLHPVAPPAPVTRAVNGTGAQLSWGAAPDVEVIGYHVYKSASAAGPFARLTSAGPLTGLSFDDPSGTAQDYYMVRALKLEQTPSGSYYNLSQGVFYPDAVGGNAGAPTTPAKFSALRLTAAGPVLGWVATAAGARGFEVQRRLYPNGTFQTIGESPASSSSYVDTTAPAAVAAYRVKALGLNEDSEYSSELVLNLRPPSAEIVGAETGTGGNWIGRFGADGYAVGGVTAKLPSYLTMSAENIAGWVADLNSTNDLTSLQRPNGGSRVLAGWATQDTTPTVYHFRFEDDRVHRVTFYLYDLPNTRGGTIRVVDPMTERVLQSFDFSNYQAGQFVMIDIRNYADVRISSAFEYLTAVWSGLFFDTPELAAPTITPATGTFPGKAIVNMASTPGATIRYTTDGSTPTAATGAIFTAPFLLTSNAVLTAKAFKAGYGLNGESAVSQARLTNDLVSAVDFVGTDAQTQGNWRPNYGTNGWMIANGTASMPGFAEITMGPSELYTWSDTTTDLRGLNRYSRVAGRLATCWYAPETLSVSTIFYTNRLQQVALYFLDWEGGRTQDVVILDGAGKILAATRLSDFKSGKYIVFKAMGFFKVSIRRMAGNNAVLSGVFFGEAAPISVAPAELGAPISINGGSFSMRIAGQVGQVFSIQSSTDFQTWTETGRQTLSTTSLNYSIPWTSAPGMKVYRAVLVP